MKAFFDACSIDIEWLALRRIDLLISHFNISFPVSPYAATSIGGFCDYSMFITFRVAVCLLRSCQMLSSCVLFLGGTRVSCKNYGGLFELYLFVLSAFIWVAV
jgi:hypothetical protein